VTLFQVELVDECKEEQETKSRSEGVMLGLDPVRPRVYLRKAVEEEDRTLTGDMDPEKDVEVISEIGRQQLGKASPEEVRG
jgi:hypothetical protein